MSYLLDTHTFLWFISDNPALSPVAKNLIASSQNLIYLSAASLWEIAIKVSLNKLQIPSPFTEFMNEQLRENDMLLLEIKTAHLGIVAALPFHHRDPFDRLIIAQSLAENLTLISKENKFSESRIRVKRTQAPPTEVDRSARQHARAACEKWQSAAALG